MDQLTTYTVKSKLNGFVWVFKYHLNGNFKCLEILEGELTGKQIHWLQNQFPFTEPLIQHWQKKLKDNFEIIQAAPVIEFENLWQLYGLKVKREHSEKAFNKLSDGEKVKCFLALKPYSKHLQKTGEARAHLVTWINQKRFNDEY